FVVLDVWPHPRGMTGLSCVLWAGYVNRVSVVIASGKRPVTFRTRKLRLTAPMVLRGGPRGRVGHRRTFFRKAPEHCSGAFRRFRACTDADLRTYRRP